VPPAGGARACTARKTRPGVPVFDVIYIAATLALFAIVGLVIKGVEKL
jgi:hypothetical protein